MHRSNPVLNTQRLRDLRIRTRLALGFAIITALTISSVLACGWLMVEQDEVFSAVLDSSVPQMTRLQAVGSEVDAINLAARDALLASNEAEAAKALQRIEAGRTIIGQQIESLRTSLSQGDVEHQALAEQLGTRSSGVLVTLVKFSRLHKSGRTEQAKALFGNELQSKMEAVTETIRAAQTIQLRELSLQKSRATERLHTSLQLAAAGLAVAVALSVLLAWRISESIAKPLQQALGVVHQIAHGDLTSKVVIDRKDEVGELLAAMVVMQETLNALVRDIAQSVHTIGSTSQELASGSEDLNQRTDETVGTLRDASAAMTELSTTFQSSAETARQADELVCGASKGVAQSGEVVAQVVHSMQNISASSSRIVDIISVIDGIAFQTNILALNAAVEAARAGEQGRGFAVVASEVRALAQRSSNAAKEIKSLISDSAEKVLTGSHLVTQAGDEMTRLVKQVEEVSNLIRTITRISEQQQLGMDNVHQSVGALSEATQLNAALVQQTSGAGLLLQEETQRLNHAIQAFRLA